MKLLEGVSGFGICFYSGSIISIEQNWAGICERSSNLINTTAQLHSFHMLAK